MIKNNAIIVLGGGIGGIVAATRLRARLPARQRVILIEREVSHVYSPSLLWLMVGRRDVEAITRPIARLAHRGIEVVRGAIEQLDPDTKTVTVNGEKYAADYMVIALGAEYASATVPGLAAAGFNFYTLGGANGFSEARLRFKRGRVVVLVSSLPFKCPAAPYEAAMLLEADFRRRGLRANVDIALYTPEPGPMPVAGAETSTRLRGLLEHKHIEYFPGHTVTEVDTRSHRIHFAEHGDGSYDLLAYVPPHRSPAVVRTAGLTDAGGWIPVNRDTLETKYPGVYAIGDVTGIPLSIGKPLPKAGVLAHGEADVVADNIVHTITGKGAPRRFLGDGACFIETGHGRAGFGSGNFFAEPAPQIRLHTPGYLHHLLKIAVEKYWLYRWF
jgi:sulfide:quinone oxidoreductase